MPYINQHSFTLIAAISFVVLAVILLRDGLQLYDALVLLALAGGLLLAYQLLKPGSGASKTAEELQSQIGAGKPVLLEFQSPY
jgi:hypothetical protein